MNYYFPTLALDDLLMQFTRALYRNTKHQKQLTSDNMRKRGLDNYVSDPSYDIGLYCTALIQRRWIEESSRIRSAIDSNHGREIRVFTWTTKAEEDLS